MHALIAAVITGPRAGDAAHTASSHALVVAVIAGSRAVDAAPSSYDALDTIVITGPCTADTSSSSSSSCTAHTAADAASSNTAIAPDPHAVRLTRSLLLRRMIGLLLLLLLLLILKDMIGKTDPAPITRMGNHRGGIDIAVLGLLDFSLGGSRGCSPFSTVASPLGAIAPISIRTLTATSTVFASFSASRTFLAPGSFSAGATSSTAAAALSGSEGHLFGGQDFFCTAEAAEASPADTHAVGGGTHPVCKVAESSESSETTNAITYSAATHALAAAASASPIRIAVLLFLLQLQLLLVEILCFHRFLLPVTSTFTFFTIHPLPSKAIGNGIPRLLPRNLAEQEPLALPVLVVAGGTSRIVLAVHVDAARHGVGLDVVNVVLALRGGERQVRGAVLVAAPSFFDQGGRL